MTCPTGKRVYRRRRDALLALERIHHARLHGAKDCHEHHFYRCPMCDRFHLTSQARQNGGAA